MRNSLRIFLGIAAAVALSCGGQSTSPGNAPAPATAAAPAVEQKQLEFMMWGTPDELETVKGYLRQFSDENPDIKIKIIHKNEYDQALMTYFAGGTPPDVMYLGLEKFPDLASRDQLLDLTPLIERDKFSLDDFYPQLVGHFKWNGSLYGIPKDFTPLVLYFNKDMFQKEGLEFPTSEWDWKKFLEASKKLTKDFDGDGMTDQYGFVVETWMAEWYPWVLQNGGRIISADNKAWLMGDPRYIEKNAEALQFLADLMWVHKAAPNATVTRDREPSAIFKAGKAAMCTYGRWMCMQFKDIKEFDWDVQVLPRGPERVSTLFTVCYSIARSSKHPEEAWRLVKFLTGPVGQKATARSGHAIPSMRSIAESPDFLEAPAVPQKINTRVFLDAVDYAVPTPTNRKWSRIQEILSRELQFVWEGKKKAKEVLAATQDELQAILDEAE